MNLKKTLCTPPAPLKKKIFAEPHGTTHRAIRRGIMSAKAGSGISVMRSDLDASTSTEVDAHDHEAQWRAGVNRQARPELQTPLRKGGRRHWLLQPSGGG